MPVPTPQTIVNSHTGARRGQKKVQPADVKTPSALTNESVYAFVLQKGPHTGRRTFVRLRDPNAIEDNAGQRRLVIKEYRYETESKAIADDLARQIVRGQLRGIKREIIVWVPCPVAGCAEKFKSNDSRALSDHYMAEHVTVDELPEDDADDDHADA